MARNDFLPVLLDRQEALRAGGLQPGSIWMLDTGFDLPLTIRRAGRDGIALRHVEAGKGVVFDGPLRKRLSDGTVLAESSEEYHLDGRPFFTHFAKASRRSFDSLEAQLWVEAIERWLVGERPAGTVMVEPDKL